MKLFPHYHQLDAFDCGPTCLRMLAKYDGRTYSVQYLREHAFITREGVVFNETEFGHCWFSTSVKGKDTGTALLTGASI